MKKSFQTIVFLATLIILNSCRTDSGNERLAGASQKVGKSAATAVKGIKEGIENVTKINVELGEKLKNSGLSLGKTKLGSKGGGRHNLLNIYMIFDKKMNKNVTIKVYNRQNEEIGRSKTLVTADEGEAKFIDFLFDKRTNIDRDYKIIME
jgi:hypothetical protein